MSFIFPFSHEELTNRLISDVTRLIYHDEKINLAETALSLMINLLRLAKDKIPEGELYRTLTEGIEIYVDKFDEYKRNMNSLIPELNESRVLCVSEKNDNVVMWSHYADEHRGVCLRLQCIEEIDNTLLLARPVKYQEDFPEFPSVVDFVSYLTGERLLSMADMLYEVPYVKHVDWSYEREWRVHVPHASAENTLHDDWQENPRVFGAIYLGCRIPAKESSEIMQMVERKYPDIEIYQAEQSTEAFVLQFERIK
jgi:hypothetical protein